MDTVRLVAAALITLYDWLTTAQILLPLALAATLGGSAWFCYTQAIRPELTPKPRRSGIHDDTINRTQP